MGLFAPGWMSKKEKRAIRSINRIKVESELAKAALEAPLAVTKKMAVERMAKADQLMHVMRYSYDWLVKKRASERLVEMEPLKGMWPNLESMDRQTILDDKALQEMFTCIAMHSPDYEQRHRALPYLENRDLYRSLYECDKRSEFGRAALSYITDQVTLLKLYDAAKDQEDRSYIVLYLQNPVFAYELARSARYPTVCVRALRHARSKELAFEIMGQTLNRDVCTACAELVDVHDIKDERRLAVIALCGPEDAREQALRRIQSEEAFVSVALKEREERFPEVFKDDRFICIEAYKRLSDAAKRRMELIRYPWSAEECEDADELIKILSICPIRYCTKEVFARLYVLDPDWPHKLDDDTIAEMVHIISENSRVERFDYAHMALVLKKVYLCSRVRKSIDALQGRPISHNDLSGVRNRDNGCHQDMGYSYFELNE